MWHCLDQGSAGDEGLKQHLASCAECEHMWQEMKQFQQDLYTFKLDRPPADFVDQVMEAINQEPIYRHHIWKKNKWAMWNHLWVASAATFVLLVMGGGFIDGSSGLPAITVYALRFGWQVTEIAGHIPNLF